MRERASYDVVVVGGGPAGATAAADLAAAGRRVLLVDRMGRIKPCGGAIPPQLIREFEIPDALLVAHIRSARMVAPSERTVDMPIDGGFVGMVDRDVFDEWLRERARRHGAERLEGTFLDIERDSDGVSTVVIEPKTGGAAIRVRARAIIGADGASSAVARRAMPRQERVPLVFAYHEIVESPSREQPGFAPTRCDVYYQGRVSPDFYGWVFPHGATTSIGVGSAHKGFQLRDAVGRLRSIGGLEKCRTLRKEGAPIPLRPRKRWDDGHGVLLVGDAAGVVAPASGEGIYYAMASGRMGAAAVESFLVTGNVRALAAARRAFMRQHGRVFWILGLLQWVWYSSDKRREKFVSMCRDLDVQRLTWEAYMNKRLVRRDPLAHLRVLTKDLAHLIGLKTS